MFDAFNLKKLKHLSIKEKAGISVYPWKNCKPDKMAEMNKPLSESKIAIVSSAGLYIRDEQQKFNHSIKGGDWSFRKISSNVDLKKLYDGHRSGTYDHSGIRTDPSIGMPIPQLRDLVNDEFIGSLNHRHISFMGSLLAPGRFIKYSIPEIVDLLLTDRVDCAIMVPI